MKKKYLNIVIILLFIFLTFTEIGIFFEVAWHGFRGFGAMPMEYTTKGEHGIGFLIFFIPLIVIVTLIIRITMCIKKYISKRELFLNCICALFGVCIGIGIITFAAPKHTVIFFWVGRQIAIFFIDSFNWMRHPIP